MAPSQETSGIARINAAISMLEVFKIDPKEVRKRTGLPEIVIERLRDESVCKTMKAISPKLEDSTELSEQLTIWIENSPVLALQFIELIIVAGGKNSQI